MQGGQRIAVIGSGVAGLGAAYFLSRRHTVTLFEALPRLGGHINTVEVDDRRGRFAIDTGFIVHNDTNYPHLLALFHELGVATQPSDMSFSVSLDQGRLEWSGDNLDTVFAQRRNLVRPRFLAMVGEILRFNRLAPRALALGRLDGWSLGEWLDENRFGHAFRTDYLLPMAAAIWSAPMSAILEFPAASFIRFFENHGLLRITGRPNWRTVVGGARSYLNRLVERLPQRPVTGTPIRRVAAIADGVVLIDASGHRRSFDQVVIATHADEALTLLDQPTAIERRVLGAFRFQSNRAILHRDASLMPQRPKVWSSWNYLAEGRRDLARRVGVTYWMNRLQRLDGATDYFVSLNPPREPAAKQVIAAFDYAHPLFDAAAIAAQQELPAIQGHGRRWFCGAWTRNGFHEDGLYSAVLVASALGAPPRWLDRGAGSTAAVAVAA